MSWFKKKESTGKKKTKLDATMKLLRDHQAKPVYNESTRQLSFNPSPHLSQGDKRKAIAAIQRPKQAPIESIFTKIVNPAEEPDWMRSEKEKGKKKQVNTLESCFRHDSKKEPITTSLNNEWGCVNSFVASAVHAWSDHLPFCMKPVHIWLLILQGVAKHVEENAEELRNKWVSHEGKKTLEVRRDGFVLGSPKNDWQGVVKEFNDQIAKNTVEDTYAILDPSFSNASLVERVAVGVTVMDICKKYFRFLCSTCCGFASITLDGTRDDWVQLRDKTERLLTTKCKSKFGKEWLKSLIPVLDRFVCAYDGSIDSIFWNSMIKKGSVGGSGGYSYFSGWINTFFPFVDEGGKNSFCFDYPWPAVGKEMESGKGKEKLPYYVSESGGLAFAGSSMAGWMMGPGDKKGVTATGAKVSAFPNGISAAPVEWNYYGHPLPMQFFSGFVGFTHREGDGMVTPVVGWCLAHTKDPKVVAGILKDKADAEEKEAEERAKGK